jgi:hypothetical protein
MQKSTAQDHCIGNQQSKNPVVEVCDAGNGSVKARYIFYEIFHKIAQFPEL